MPPDVRALIRELSTANLLWGAPRIHGELQKLGVSVSQSTLAKYMRRHPRPPSQTWRTFLADHARQIIAVDLFVVPAVTFRMVFVLVILAHERRRIVHVAVTDHLSFATIGSGGHLKCAAVVKPLRHTATSPKQCDEHDWRESIDAARAAADPRTSTCQRRPADRLRTSGCASFVAMVKSAHFRERDHATFRRRVDASWRGCVLREGEMGSRGVQKLGRASTLHHDNRT